MNGLFGLALTAEVILFVFVAWMAAGPMGLLVMSLVLAGALYGTGFLVRWTGHLTK